MRADIKFGIVLSMVVVMVAGGYYLYRDRQESPIPLSQLTLKNKNPQANPAISKPIDRQTFTKRPRKNMPAGKPVQATAQKNSSASKSSKVASRIPSGSAKPVGINVPMRKSAINKTTQTAKKNDTNPSNPSLTDPKVQYGPSSLIKDHSMKRNLSAVNQAKMKTKNKGFQTIVLESHRVQPGETFSSLATMYYGNERYTQFLISYNPQILNPDALKVGMMIKIPPLSADQQTRKSSAQPTKKTSPLQRQSSKTYLVQPGDSFYLIAQKQLGDSSRWEELFDLNRNLVNGNPRQLRAGQTIILP